MKLLFFFFLSSFSLKNYTLSMSFTQPVMKTLLSSCLFLSLLIPITEAQPQVLCNSDNNYTQGSQYQSNLKVVINSLVSNIITSGSNIKTIGFYNITLAGADPDKVYGLLQCRAGISPDECQSCANTSSAEIVKQCSYNKEGIFMGSETVDCVLRYAGTNFFGTADDRVIVTVNGNNASDQVVFRNELDDLLDKLSAEAASYGTRLSYNSKNDIYGMVQCTRDLSEASCLSCLQHVRLKIRKEKVGGLYLSPSCFIKYEIDPFDGVDWASSSSPTPTTDANSTNPKSSSPPTPTTDANSTKPGSENGNNQRNIILATVIPTVSIFVATTCVFLLRRKHRRKKHGYVEMDISHTNSLTFHLNTLRVATNNFSESNNLGEGGFGSVYKTRASVYYWIGTNASRS